MERVPTSSFRGSCAEKAGGAERTPWGQPVARQQDSARAYLHCPGAAGGAAEGTSRGSGRPSGLPAEGLLPPGRATARLAGP